MRQFGGGSREGAFLTLAVIMAVEPHVAVAAAKEIGKRGRQRGQDRQSRDATRRVGRKIDRQLLAFGGPAQAAGDRPAIGQVEAVVREERSEERRGRKEWVSTCRARGVRFH